MTIFTDSNELDILLDEIVKGFVEQGKSYEWIYKRITSGIASAIQDHEDNQRIGVRKDE